MAGGRFAPGHLGELTRVVPFEMVDAVLAETGKVQTRVRDLPSRVVVYLLLAAGLFAELGFGQVWAKMTAGLDGLAVATPTAGALAQARRRIGVAPLRALFDLVRGPAAGLATNGVYWRGLLVTAVDGTMMCCPDTTANLRVYRKGGGHHGGTGYPMVRLLALVACGTRHAAGVAAPRSTPSRAGPGYVRPQGRPPAGPTPPAQGRQRLAGSRAAAGSSAALLTREGPARTSRSPNPPP